MGTGAGKLDAYTMDEIAKHNTAESCWVVSRGRVYDATEFLPLHPGAGSMILRKGGGDVTYDYDMHTRKQRAVWARFMIGRLQRCSSAKATEIDETPANPAMAG